MRRQPRRWDAIQPPPGERAAPDAGLGQRSMDGQLLGAEAELEPELDNDRGSSSRAVVDLRDRPVSTIPCVAMRSMTACSARAADPALPRHGRVDELPCPRLRFAGSRRSSRATVSVTPCSRRWEPPCGTPARAAYRPGRACTRRSPRFAAARDDRREERHRQLGPFEGDAGVERRRPVAGALDAERPPCPLTDAPATCRTPPMPSSPSSAPSSPPLRPSVAPRPTDPPSLAPDLTRLPRPRPLVAVEAVADRVLEEAGGRRRVGEDPPARDLHPAACRTLGARLEPAPVPATRRHRPRRRARRTRRPCG